METTTSAPTLDRCATCGAHLFTFDPPHRCPPPWMVWDPQEEGGEASAQLIYALYASTAAEGWAAKYGNRHNLIVLGGRQTVCVRSAAGEVTSWDVHGELEPVYSAFRHFPRAAPTLMALLVLVLGGCGSAVLSGSVTGGIGLLGIALAFGLTVLTMAFAVGHISGGHFNPAVTVGLWSGGRFPARDVGYYILAQVVGAIIAAFVLYGIASGKAGFVLHHGALASNGYDAGSPGHYGLAIAFLTEVVMTAMFVLVIMGATDRLAPLGAAPIAIGLALTLIHLVSIPVSNTSVNPARSTGPALVEGGLAFAQLWLFWLAPLIGGMLGGLVYRYLLSERETD